MGGKSVKKLVVSLAILFVLCLSSTAKAETITLRPPVDPSTGQRDLGDLDHHNAYAWRIDNVNLNGKVITGARLTISNIRNWDANANRLFMHLLDSARVAGVSTFVDATGAPVPANQIIDDFANPRFHNNPNWLTTSGTADTYLTESSFGTSATNFVYNFTQAQVDALFAYISNNGSFALGFDPDCHFFNSGITFEIFTASAASVPEPATLALLGTGLAGLYARKRRKQQKTQSAV